MAFVMERSLAAKDSHESFHSSHSQPEPMASSQATTDLHVAALQAAGLPVYDIDAFLNDPRNQGTLASKSPLQKKQKINQNGSSSLSSTPRQLGAPKTTHNVPLLYKLCQERGLALEFQIDGDQFEGFGGIVKVGGQAIASERRWPNKKEAKEGLAELGVPVVREMRAVSREKSASAEQGEPEKNWVGMLLEYYNNIDATAPGPLYTEYAINHTFACTVALPTLPTTPFGSPNNPFPTKKAARSNAAKEAVCHLISTGDLNPDGSTKTRKKYKGVAAGPTVRIDAKGVGVKKDATYANRVNDLCPLLSLTPPLYRLTPTSAAAPSMFTGAAFFTGDAMFHELLKGGVGEVRNVFGKKNAKEECARKVWEVLREVARGRGVEVEEVEG
ncbi:MAG: hypothetical protein Q9166_004597 [cf. Caloplaca sp. 2 TL-2023]